MFYNLYGIIIFFEMKMRMNILLLFFGFRSIRILLFGVVGSGYFWIGFGSGLTERRNCLVVVKVLLFWLLGLFF